MNFLIDTNICSAYLKGEHSVWNRFVQHAGGLAISVITAGELWTWVKRGKTSARSQQSIAEFINLVEVVEVDLEVALRFGELRAHDAPRCRHPARFIRSRARQDPSSRTHCCRSRRPRQHPRRTHPRSHQLPDARSRYLEVILFASKETKDRKE